MGNPDLPRKKALRKVLGLLNVMILKRVREGIFFQSNIFTACNIKDEEEVEFFDGVDSTEDCPSISR